MAGGFNNDLMNATGSTSNPHSAGCNSRKPVRYHANGPVRIVCPACFAANGRDFRRGLVFTAGTERAFAIVRNWHGGRKSTGSGSATGGQNNPRPGKRVAHEAWNHQRLHSRFSNAQLPVKAARPTDHNTRQERATCLRLGIFAGSGSSNSR